MSHFIYFLFLTVLIYFTTNRKQVLQANVPVTSQYYATSGFRVMFL